MARTGTQPMTVANTDAVAAASQHLSFALQQNEELLSAITECLTLGRLNDAVR